ncbi:Protein phosphatase 2C 3 [Neolecta irregularis DAH-3]|uniref:protein-serine/threonine phosphatase n=1 Tax=Neolecta irregularis (strain DAH-3) TaxID=1198029 RepID=A0A1U7LRS5_NEOID|nr:Protein phosphatase 2C 3 [Neolecta irregularis DAH-3]|eukprot:OLL25221.1 Protein phosphatase 2C 3 [Neolecta irregularis DAH-3]
MGQVLSEPVTEKRSASGEDDRLIYGLSDMQGWRISMEDAHATILSLPTQEAGKKNSFFGVYDGHGGNSVAHFTGLNLHAFIAKQEAFTQGNYEQALKYAFLAIDEAILADNRYNDDPSGCTATCCIVTDDNRIFTANAGDSRAVLGCRGQSKPLSFDHKPQNEIEKARICAAGGYVDFGRVNAIGDFEFKKNASISPENQIVTAFPDVTEHQITADDEFIVVACDGIWDCQSSEEVIKFVRRGITADQELHKICENLMDNCMAPSSETGGVGCDNMTVIIVGLLQGKTKAEWYKMIADRVAQGDGPCAPPHYAECRGPGYRHNKDVIECSDDEFEKDYGLVDSQHSIQTRFIINEDGSRTLNSDKEMVQYNEEMEVQDETDASKVNGYPAADLSTGNLNSADQ